MRQRFRERGGGGGGGGGFPGFGGGSGGGGPGARRASDGPITRTVYVVDKTQPAESNGGKPVLKQVTIKVGIADNSYTEVVDGLKDTDEVVDGINTPIVAAASQVPQGRSPFGGGGGFGGPRR